MHLGRLEEASKEDKNVFEQLGDQVLFLGGAAIRAPIRGLEEVGRGLGGGLEEVGRGLEEVFENVTDGQRRGNEI